MDETHFQARQIIADAEAEATAIVSNARLEAQRLRDDPTPSGPDSVDTVQKLQGAIDGFDEVNHELLREITALRQVLDADIQDPWTGRRGR